MLVRQKTASVIFKRVIPLTLVLPFLVNNPLPVLSQTTTTPIDQIQSKTLDQRAQVLAAYLAAHNSPLEYHVQDFVDQTTDNNDWNIQGFYPADAPKLSDISDYEGFRDDCHPLRFKIDSNEMSKIRMQFITDPRRLNKLITTSNEVTN